jgi:porphobilinogen synthase
MIHDRPRRLRSSPAVRDLVAETRVHASHLVQPHFVVADDGADVPVDALPGIARKGVDVLLRTVEQDLELGVRSALLFGVVDDKDAHGTAGHDPAGPVQRAVRALKDRFGDDLHVIADVCLCTYTDHGHCGVVDGDRVQNDASLPLLARQAVSLAEAGADMIAPSDMMDGRVLALREALDEADLADCAIMSYAAKYASSFYGPFREAAASAPKGGTGPKDRRTYQMDYRNRGEAVREALLDVEEGADVIMVKPALAYLDVIQSVRAAIDRPVAAYLVSGEYAAVEALAEKGLADRAALVHEHLTAVRRAGADILITYHARRAIAEGWLERSH